MKRYGQLIWHNSACYRAGSARTAKAPIPSNSGGGEGARARTHTHTHTLVALRRAGPRKDTDVDCESSSAARARVVSQSRTRALAGVARRHNGTAWTHARVAVSLCRTRMHVRACTHARVTGGVLRALTGGVLRALTGGGVLRALTCTNTYNCRGRSTTCCTTRRWPRT